MVIFPYRWCIGVSSFRVLKLCLRLFGIGTNPSLQIKLMLNFCHHNHIVILTPFCDVNFVSFMGSVTTMSILCSIHSWSKHANSILNIPICTFVSNNFCFKLHPASQLKSPRHKPLSIIIKVRHYIFFIFIPSPPMEIEQALCTIPPLQETTGSALSWLPMASSNFLSLL